MDEAVRRGVDLVELYVADRPAEIRAWLEKAPIGPAECGWFPSARRPGACGCRADRSSPRTRQPRASRKLPRSFPAIGSSCKSNGSRTARRKRSRSTASTRPAGGWDHEPKSIPRARLNAPFWIGARARIGPELRDRSARPDRRRCNPRPQRRKSKRRACCRELTSGETRGFSTAAAAGNELVDFRRGCRVDITEPFIMGLVDRALAAAGRFRARRWRCCAGCCFSPLSPPFAEASASAGPSAGDMARELP